jgi:predicted nucleotidyltransferase
MKLTFPHAVLRWKKMKKELKEKLRQLGVRIVYRFGSRTQRVHLPSSDFDIGVVVGGPGPGEDTRALYDSLYRIFSERFPSFKLDIVFLQKSPLPLQFSAITEGKILFEESPIFTADYENRVINAYLDFKPILDYFDSINAQRYGET